MKQEVDTSKGMTIAPGDKTEPKLQERNVMRSLPAVMESRKMRVEAATAAISARSSPRTMTRRKGHYVSPVRSGDTYPHSVQTKQKMPITVVSGRRKKTSEKQ